MKKLIPILLILIVSSVYSQNVIITTTGDTITGKIEFIIRSKIKLSEKIESMDSYTIPINQVYEIKGDMPKYRHKAIRKVNPNVILETNERRKKADYYSPNYSIKNYRATHYINKSPGDLIEQSGELRLAGLGISATTGILFATGIFDNMTLKEKNYILLLTGAASLTLYITAEVTLIKAGRKMNREAVTLKPSNSGIGLAINF